MKTNLFDLTLAFKLDQSRASFYRVDFFGLTLFLNLIIFSRQVFPNNIMPANAAAWYMAKRKFYVHQSFDQQLLPFLLKKYPDKFLVKKNTVRTISPFLRLI